MEIEVIEIKVTRHVVEVNDSWPIEAQTDEAAAIAYLEEATNAIGFDSINKLESNVIKHEMAVNGNNFAQ